MQVKIEEAFNDCFERLCRGDSLENCLMRYPQYTAELDSLLRTTFDVKRRVYPVQPRPEFKYWSRVRLQGVQEYLSRQPVREISTASHLRRNLAISLTAILAFIIVTSGTAAASSDSLPDEPLYGVKMAVEQAQVAFARSDVDKAEIYARLAEKRASEIVAMARQGKADKTSSTLETMNYQLDQAEHYINQYQQDNSDSDISGSSVPTPAPTAPFVPTGSATSNTTATIPPMNTEGLAGSNTSTTPGSTPAAHRAANINRAKATVNESTAKSLAILQQELTNAPESAKPFLRNVIIRTKKANEWSQQQPNADTNNPGKSSIPATTPNILPSKPPLITPPNRPRLVPPNINKPIVPNTLPQSSSPDLNVNGSNSDDSVSQYEEDKPADQSSNTNTGGTLPGIIRPPWTRPVSENTVNAAGIQNDGNSIENQPNSQLR